MRPTDDLLDRAWAATRPEEPSSAAFEAAWARVVAEADRPAVLAFARPSWKPRVLPMAAVGQAAALLIAGFAALRTPAPSLVAVPPGPVASVGECVGAEGATLFVVLDGARRTRVEVELRPETPVSETDMVASESDVFGHMESLGEGAVE